MPHRAIFSSAEVASATTATVSAVGTSDATTVSVPTLQTLLGEVLEVCIHELLYQRALYPREIFVATRDYLGIRHHVTCNEEISIYIVNTLDVAVPAICSGLADKVSFDIVIEDNIVESYIFEIDSRLLADGGGRDQWDTQKVSILERHFKNLVLKIITFEDIMSPLSPDAKFKLRLHTIDGNNQDQHGCRELHHAIKTGIWLRSSDTNRGVQTIRNNGNLVIRSLKSVHVPECHLRMEFTLQFVETDE